MNNTENRNPLLNLMTVMENNGIERQEKQGQMELINSNQLPTKVSDSGKLSLESDGVVFGDIDPQDPLFCNVKLPDGWKIIETDHSMWTNLVDDKGRERASIFYKAAFYDRRATLNVTEIKE